MRAATGRGEDGGEDEDEGRAEHRQGGAGRGKGWSARLGAGKRARCTYESTTWWQELGGESDEGKQERSEDRGELAANRAFELSLPLFPVLAPRVSLPSLDNTPRVARICIVLFVHRQPSRVPRKRHSPRARRFYIIALPHEQGAMSELRVYLHKQRVSRDEWPHGGIITEAAAAEQVTKTSIRVEAGGVSVGERLGGVCARTRGCERKEKEREKHSAVCYRFEADPAGGDGLTPLSALFRRDLPNPRPIPSVRC